MDNSMPMRASAYLTCAEAGSFVGLSPRTLEKFRTLDGGPRFLKLGRRVMYKQSDLEAWADARGCASTFDPAYIALCE